MKRITPLRKSPLKRQSKKRAQQNRQYAKLRKAFLEKRRLCEIYETNCIRTASQVHHVNGRNGKRLLDTKWWLPACFTCHRFLHDHPAYAREAGFLL